jgi:hypothetical protein
MKKAVSGLLLLVLAVAALGMAAYPAAAANETIPSLNALTLTYNLSEGDTITGDWSSDGSLTFVLRGPGSAQISTSTGTSGIILHICQSDGSYVLSWTNLNLGAVDLEYDVTVSDLGGGFLDDIGTAILIGLLVFVAVIVIVIVIVVLVVMRGKKSKQAAAAGPVITPAVGGNCPVCGMPVDPQVAFCAKCGAKLR